ncbi:MAG TPA: hypothetical protein VG328_06805 [Stellaceae bacterium]|jgi:hypothetical protein|nr:hypothetical protein [Stellaceae bacterium]
MRALDEAQIRNWCHSHSVRLDERARPTRNPDGFTTARFKTPAAASRHLWFAKQIEYTLCLWSRCLFWVLTWGVWQSSENWHLYYKLRQSCGDHRLLEEAPAHLFLDFETADVVTFIQVALSAGWNFQLLTSEDHARAFISHDEWIELTLKDAHELDQISDRLVQAGIERLAT